MTRPKVDGSREEQASSRKLKIAHGRTPQDAVIERALIIRPEPLEWILDGKKVWELRTQPTKVRSLIALLEKGTKRILGTCRLVDCLGPLSAEEFIANARKMNESESELEDDRKALEDKLAYGLYAWVLKDARRLAKPVRFQNPSGAVTWVRLPPGVSAKLLPK